MFNFRAHVVGGEILDRGPAFPSIDHLPDSVFMLEALSDDGAKVLGVVRVDPAKGETLHGFTRRRQAVGTDGTFDVPVLEARTASGPVRLYLHPDGAILSTLDLYF